MFHIRSLVCALVLVGPPVWAATLESPASGAILSGIGFISGWKCQAGTITVRINAGAPIPVATSQPRADTRRVCGTEKNGFITQMNWALLGDGAHTAVAYDNGVEFARATFTVGTTGEEWVEDVTVSIDVPNFPAPGETGHFVWNESTQHMELAQVERTRVTPELPPPPQAGGRHMYWIDGWPPGKIQRATLTGTQVTTLVTGEQTPPGDIGMYDQLALDVAAGTLYWGTNDGLYRMTLTGAQVTQIVALDDFDGFTLDPVGRKLYWADNERIWWANLDGSQVAPFPGADPRYPPTHDLLVVDSGKLYWIDDGPDRFRLRRANLNGTQAEVLLTKQTMPVSWDMESFAVDAATGKFYWIDGSLFRANLNDGSHIETLVSRMGDGTGLALDLAGGKMYWTLWSAYGSYDYGVYRANLDGSQVEALVTGGDPWDVVLSLE